MTKKRDDHEIRHRLALDVLAGYERWHTESDKRRARRYYFESTGDVEAEESEINGFLQWYTTISAMPPPAAPWWSTTSKLTAPNSRRVSANPRGVARFLARRVRGGTRRRGPRHALARPRHGETIFVHDVTASRELVRGDCCLTRIEKLDGKLMFVSDGSTVPPAVRDEFLELIDKEAGASGQTRAEYVRRSGNLLYRKIRNLSDEWMKNLRIVNREGDALEFCHADYSVWTSPPCWPNCVRWRNSWRRSRESRAKPTSRGSTPPRKARVPYTATCRWAAAICGWKRNPVRACNWAADCWKPTPAAC
jgi:hypothetical protein